jgi:hypothetical protein
MVSLMLPIEIVRWISESSGLTSTEMLGPLASRAAPSAKANHASRSSCPTFAVGSQESRHGCPCSSRPSKATLPMALAVDGHHVEDLAHLVPLLADARRRVLPFCICPKISSIKGGSDRVPPTWAIFQSSGAGDGFYSGADSRAPQHIVRRAPRVGGRPTVIEWVELGCFAGFGAGSGGTHRVGAPRVRLERPWEPSSIWPRRET